MSPPSRPDVRAVVFDLDGTLVQTRLASWEVFEPISRRFGLGIDTPGQYFELFRGNVFTSIRERCEDEAHAAEATAEFLTALREHYDPPLVPGMPAVVRRLASECTLAVMSSNAMEVLRRVLVDNGLAYCFAHVFGGDVAPDKRAALRSFLADAGSGYGRRCSADYDEGGEATRPDPATTVLVTDTAGDVRDAVEVGVRVIGVAWGMHEAAELTAAGAEFVALWPQEVLSHLLGERAAREPTGACAVPGTSGPGSGSGSADCGCGCSSDVSDPGSRCSSDVSDPGSGCSSDVRKVSLPTLEVRKPSSITEPVEPPGERRRRRRREAAESLQTARPEEAPRRSSNGRGSEPRDELLEAMRRICRAG